MSFGRDFVDLLFAQPIGRTQLSNMRRIPMTFGRDVFDLVLAQPIGQRNNHLNKHLQKRNS